MSEDNDRWPVALFRGARDNRPKLRTWDTGTLVRALAIHREWTGPKVDAPAWSPVIMPDGARRAKKNVEAVSMLVLDCDAGESLEALEALGDDFVRLGHTSWSHSAGHPKARLVFPFAAGSFCPAGEWDAVWSAAARWAAAQGVTVDAAAKDPSRLYFGPYVPPGALSGAVRWVYGPYEDGDARRPARERRWLSWAWLVTEYPAPDSELDDFDMVPPYAAAGRRDDSNERQERRRRAFGHGLVTYRANKLSRAGQGGRNNSLYGAARLVAQLEAAGAVDARSALAELHAAAVAAGLTVKETKRTLSGGYATGRNDPEYPVDREMA